MSVAVERRRFTVDEYHRMAQAGLLSQEEQVELVNGEILTMPPIGPAHAGRVKRLNRRFSRDLDDRAIVSVQDPIQISPDSEPLPDIALLAPRRDFYASGHPRPRDVLLLIEIAETSLDYDREVKIPMYARARIREVWLLDLANQLLYVYTRPGGDGYASVRELRPGDRVSPEGLPDIHIAVEQLFE